MKHNARDASGKFRKKNFLDGKDLIWGPELDFPQVKPAKMMTARLGYSSSAETEMARIWCDLAHTVEGHYRGQSALTTDELATNTSYLFNKMMKDITKANAKN